MMDAAAPAVALAGDAATDAMGQGLAGIGSAAGTALSSGVGSALSMIPGIGPALGAGAGTAGSIASAIAPQMANAGAQLAMQAPKIAGRMAYQAGSGALRQAEQAAGGSGMGPAMSRALTQRAAMSTGLPSAPGGGAPTPGGGDIMGIGTSAPGTPVSEYTSPSGAELYQRELAKRGPATEPDPMGYNKRPRFAPRQMF
jgi:hypothetical protein